jgi:hypothetical protein
MHHVLFALLLRPLRRCHRSALTCRLRVLAVLLAAILAGGGRRRIRERHAGRRENPADVLLAAARLARSGSSASAGAALIDTLAKPHSPR